MLRAGNRVKASFRKLTSKNAELISPELYFNETFKVSANKPLPVEVENFFEEHGGYIRRVTAQNSVRRAPYLLLGGEYEIHKEELQNFVDQHAKILEQHNQNPSENRNFQKKILLENNQYLKSIQDLLKQEKTYFIDRPRELIQLIELVASSEPVYFRAAAIIQCMSVISTSSLTFDTGQYFHLVGESGSNFLGLFSIKQQANKSIKLKTKHLIIQNAVVGAGLELVVDVADGDIVLEMDSRHSVCCALNPSIGKSNESHSEAEQYQDPLFAY